MTPLIKKILLSLSIIAAIVLLMLFSIKSLQRPDVDENTGTKADYIEPSKDITKALEKKDGLSQEGQEAKRRLVSGLNGEAGIILESTQFRIEYYPPLNNLKERFVVTIKTSNFEPTKELVRDWLLSKGFSQNDVCELPMAFYPGPDILTTNSRLLDDYNPVLKNCD